MVKSNPNKSFNCLHFFLLKKDNFNVPASRILIGTGIELLKFLVPMENNVDKMSRKKNQISIPKLEIH